MSDDDEIDLPLFSENGTWGNTNPEMTRAASYMIWGRRLTEQTYLAMLPGMLATAIFIYCMAFVDTIKDYSMFLGIAILGVYGLCFLLGFIMDSVGRYWMKKSQTIYASLDVDTQV